MDSEYSEDDFALMDQDSFIEKRGQVFVGRQVELEEMRKFVTSQEENVSNCLIVVGQSGMGKSSIMSRMVLKMKEVNYTMFYFVYFHSG